MSRPNIRQVRNSILLIWRSTQVGEGAGLLNL